MGCYNLMGGAHLSSRMRRIIIVVTCLDRLEMHGSFDSTQKRKLACMHATNFQ